MSDEQIKSEAATAFEAKTGAKPLESGYVITNVICQDFNVRKRYTVRFEHKTKPRVFVNFTE